MNSEPGVQRDFAVMAPQSNRQATSTLDLLVALTLLVAVIGVATPLSVRHGRLLKSQRNYRVALDELSNQVERLSVLPAGELPRALDELKPSDFVMERLADVELGGELRPFESATRVTLRISWSEMERKLAPLSLSAWVYPPAPRPGNERAEAESE
jgi:hypothetical protein